MSKGDDDIIRDVLGMVRTLATSLPDQAWLELEWRARQAWGGERVYVPKGPILGKALRAGAAVATGATLSEAFRVAGVSRRHGYRLLQRRWIVR